jgi:hypothetical protein
MTPSATRNEVARMWSAITRSELLDRSFDAGLAAGGGDQRSKMSIS